MPQKDKGDVDIESEDSWDFESAERRDRIADRRAVVSVAFPSKDLATVSAAARQSDMKVSEFIRAAAIEKAYGGGWLMAISRTFSFSSSARLNSIQVTETMSAQQPEPIIIPVVR